LGLVSLDGACEEQEEGKNQLLAVEIIVRFLLRNNFFVICCDFGGGRGFGGSTGQRYTAIHTSLLRLHSPRILNILVVGFFVFLEWRGEGNARPHFSQSCVVGWIVCSTYLYITIPTLGPAAAAVSSCRNLVTEVTVMHNHTFNWSAAQCGMYAFDGPTM
jgi:hypothetical protein